MHTRIRLSNAYHRTHTTIDASAAQYSEGFGIFISTPAAHILHRTLCSGLSTCGCANSIGENPPSTRCIPCPGGFIYLVDLPTVDLIH
jgi:hypothetical protein